MSNSQQQLSASPRSISPARPESKRRMGEEVVRRLEKLSMHDDNGDASGGHQHGKQEGAPDGVKAHQYEENEGKEASEEDQEQARDRRELQEQESFARDYFDGHIKEAIGEPRSMQVVELVSRPSLELS